ncbi:MAG: TetR/AcrR family transcriptional regulator [Xanthobacteraceae bacterium]
MDEAGANPREGTKPRAKRGGNGARAQKSAARREAILAAALDEFSLQGFAAARLDDVARRAGVAKGTIYLHFRDKETLFQELIRSVLSPFVGTLEIALRRDVPVRVIVGEVVELFVTQVYSTRRKDVIRLILSEGSRFPNLAEFYSREVLSRIMAAVRDLMRRAVARGEIKGDAAVRFPQLVGAPAVVAILWSSLFEKFEPLDVRAFMHAHLDLLFTGERAP